MYIPILLLATVTSSYDAVLHGMDWRADQGMAVSALLEYNNEPDFVLTRLLFGDAAMVRRNAAYMEANKLGAFGDPTAIPTAVSNYIRLPKSIEGMLDRNPEHQEAIRTMWRSYQSAGDLRKAFNPLSEQFAGTLLEWTIGAIADTPTPHYLRPNLVRFSADYRAIKQAETK